ncbi:MAG: hypothetical protein JRN68_09320 [Nitrososphaerota archaeon]|nr:hypothetical protein [Nitrososphaerota archaeon]
MRLNVFNLWRDLGNYFGRTLQYQTSKVKGSNKLFVTFVKDAKSNATVAKAYGMTNEASREAALKLLKSVGAEAVWNAIQSGKPIVQSETQKPTEPKKDIEWRDGINHRYRAQKRIVGEGEEIMEKEGKPRIRNFVAKHARAVNKGGPMKDKKNDYKRKPKHNKKFEEGV